MQDSTHSVEGNRWSSSLGTSRVEQDCTSYNHNGDLGYSHGDKNGCVERIYVRPNYSDPNPPTNVTLSNNQIWYDINDTITLYPRSDNASDFYMAIYKDGNVVRDGWINGEYSVATRELGFGNYTVWVTASNSAGTADSNHIDFSVVDKAGYDDVYVSKPIYDLNDTVEITVKTVCAKGQVIGLDKNGERIITESCDSTFKKAASELGIGSYSAYFSVYNGSGGIDTKRVTFEIANYTDVNNNIPVDIGDDFYANIEQQSTGLLLINQGNNVVGEKKSCSEKQIWHFKKLANGAYIIQSEYNSSVMDVSGVSDEDNANVYTWSEYNQQFYIIYKDNAYYIRPAHSTTKVLDLDSTEGHNLKIWSMGNDWNPQKFNINKLDSNKAKHDYSIKVVPATCTSKGYTLHKCSICGDEYKDTETNASGHKYTSSVTKKASCTEDGTMTYTCDCGDSYTETIKAAGHKYETTTVPPTDTEAGYDEHVCSVCGDSYKDNIIPANGHSYTSEITKPASCTEDGLKTFTCTSCGDTYTEIIKATGHEYISSVIPPDCTSDGYTVHICKKCNDSYTDERIKATGHKYVDTVIAPTTTEQGCTHHKCSDCGDEYDDSFVDPIQEEPITFDIILNANDKTMSSENVNISINGEEASTSENGSAELSLADGTHEITFSAHGFVPRTYTVEVKNGKLNEELTPELNLIGDADGNRVVNTLDIVKLKRHLIKVEPLKGYALDCANTDGNDTLNTLDIVKLKRHLINVEKLW